MSDLPKGWAFTGSGRKAHYFDNDSFSLCRKWGFYFGEAEDTMDDHVDNCAECRKKKAKLDAKRKQAATQPAANAGEEGQS